MGMTDYHDCAGKLEAALQLLMFKFLKIICAICWYRPLRGG